MKATIIECIIGVLGFNEQNNLVESILFPKDSKKIAENLTKIETGIIINEIATLVENLKEKGYTFFVFENAAIARNVHDKLKITFEVKCPSEAGELLRGDLEKYAVKLRFVKDGSELRDWTHKISLELTKIRVRKAGEKRDLVVAQAIQTINDIDKTINLFMGRIREWYGLHFPELDRKVDKHETISEAW